MFAFRSSPIDVLPKEAQRERPAVEQGAGLTKFDPPWLRPTPPPLPVQEGEVSFTYLPCIFYLTATLIQAAKSSQRFISGNIRESFNTKFLLVHVDRWPESRENSHLLDDLEAFQKCDVLHELRNKSIRFGRFAAGLKVAIFRDWSEVRMDG